MNGKYIAVSVVNTSFQRRLRCYWTIQLLRIAFPFLVLFAFALGWFIHSLFYGVH